MTITAGASASAPAGPSEPAGISAGLTFLLALATGTLVAGIYYAQPLVALIGPDVGLDESVASFVVTLAQVGYGIGLLLLVPLGDRLENRALVTTTAAVAVAALVCAAFATTGPVFLLAALAVGVASSCVQMILPIAVHLAPEESRGRVVGNVMSGLILGILLARPFASLVAHHLGWRAVFLLAAALDAAVAITLWRVLPVRRPHPHGSYVALIRSLWPILRDQPVLRRRAAYQGLLFGLFTLYWTAVPLELASPRFGLSQDGIALFALCGASGALAAPAAGRLADRGYGRALTGVAMASAVLSFWLAWIGGHSIVALGAAAVVLDAGIQLNQITGQRAIYGLGAEMRSRINGLYMALFFFVGALGSAVASPVFVRAGWPGISLLGLAVSIAATLVYLTEFRGRSR